MNVVGYVRVSTVGQVSEGLGLQDQEAAIRAWAQAEGYVLVDVYTDAAISGTKDLDVRVGLADALAAIREGEAAGLIVYSLDRLARDVILQEQLLAEVWRIGGEVYSTRRSESNLHDDPEDPSRRMIRVILGAVAEYERNMIVLRLRRGRASKASRGGYAYGAPPLGTRAVEHDLVPVEGEAETVAFILRSHAAGESLRGIVAALEGRGARTKRGGQWWPSTVSKVIKRAQAA